MPLYKRHDIGLQSAWSNLAQNAESQTKVITGAPGGIIRITKHGHEYLVHQQISPGGQRRQIPIGRADDPVAQQASIALQAQIDVSKRLIDQARVLFKIGYQAADNKAFGVAAILHNATLFQQGLTLIGSHAYGALLNTLGIYSAAYQTDDVDISRHHQLAVPAMDLAEILAQTLIKFVPVPAINRNDPSTSFKEVGPSAFRVDILVPSATDKIGRIKVPELNVYATTLPLLSYLLEDTFMSSLASRHGVVPVRVPDPARFAMHKLAISQERVNMRDKRDKDVHQACVLIAALAETQPYDIEVAALALPPRAVENIYYAMPAAAHILSKDHPDALATLYEILSALGNRDRDTP